MLRDLTKDDDYSALKRAAEERKEWRYSGMIVRNLLYSGRLKKKRLADINPPDITPMSVVRPDVTPRTSEPLKN